MAHSMFLLMLYSSDSEHCVALKFDFQRCTCPCVMAYSYVSTVVYKNKCRIKGQLGVVDADPYM